MAKANPQRNQRALTRHNPRPFRDTDVSLPIESELDAFLRSVERRAFKRTAYMVRDEQAALDIVQDSMIRLAQSYVHRPAEEWPMLFQRILSNATMDHFRRQRVRNGVMVNLSDFEGDDADDSFNLLEVLSGGDGSIGFLSAEGEVERAQVVGIIEEEIQKLPARQREAFLLRYWEDFDTAETASVMGCSEGSVKTHCSRAVHALAKALTARGIQR
jgi:RNA polymerase sigma-70 factor, ECF subfamily